MKFSSISMTLAVAAFFVGVESQVQAAFILPSWTRGQADSTYQGWDIFSTPAGPNAPNTPTPAIVDAAPFNTYGTANVSESSGQSFITSGGNIYSPTAAIAIQVTVPNGGLAGHNTQVLLQFRTQGSALDFSTLTINGTAVSTLSGYSLTELERVALGGFGGDRVDTAIGFTVPGNAALYTFNVVAASSSTSFDRLSVDTFASTTAAVPEPATLWMAGLGVMGLLARRKCRN